MRSIYLHQTQLTHAKQCFVVLLCMKRYNSFNPLRRVHVAFGAGYWMHTFTERFSGKIRVCFKLVHTHQSREDSVPSFSRSSNHNMFHNLNWNQNQIKNVRKLMCLCFISDVYRINSGRGESISNTANIHCRSN